jgi:isoquinoline 1-oxidoreductase
MKTISDYQPGFEPERYELDAGPAYRFTLGRRKFFKMLGGGIVVLLLVDKALAQESGGGRRRGRSQGGSQEIGAWIHIDENGAITVYTGKVEVGQNIRTSLTQAVADELRAPIESIQMVMGDTALVPFDRGTFGSRTTPDMSRQLRRVAAATRELLLDEAAAKFKADRGTLTIQDGMIIEKSGKEHGFGEITRGEKLTKAIAENPPVTPADRWTIAGKSHRKVNGRELVTGRHEYASDIKLEGMLHGKVLRPKYPDSHLQFLNTKKAEAPGISLVHDGDFVAVAAPTEHEAAHAIRRIECDWLAGKKISDNELFDHLKASGFGNSRGGRERATKSGSMKEGLAGADVQLKKSYTVAYIAHAPLEPRAAVAKWDGDELTVWTGTQRPFGVRGELAGAFGIPEEKIHVLMPDTGGAYGGKHTGEAAVEAARIAKAAGKPVKLVWTREEEFSWAYFRPAGVIEVSSGAKKDGTLTAWEFHNYNSGGSSIRTPYEVPNQWIQFHPANSPLRQGSYRGLAATANTFARESHMDELAHELKMDPLEFRLKNLKDERLRAVLQAAAEKFKWPGKSSDGHGFGIAAGAEKGGYLATFAEVAVDQARGRVQVVRAVSAFECGAVVNPDQLKNLVTGALIMGLGGALFEAIHFESGHITNPFFSEYRVPRFADFPEVEVVLLDRKDIPSAGAGETPIIGIAPAVGNAIFAATGKRLRSMPMIPDGLKA